MFSGCENFNQDINEWKLSSAQQIHYFLFDTKIKEKDINKLLSSIPNNVDKRYITN